jgi:hypothetical protein
VSARPLQRRHSGDTALEYFHQGFILDDGRGSKTIRFVEHLFRRVEG